MNTPLIHLPDESQILDRLNYHLEHQTTDTSSYSEHQWSSQIYMSQPFFEDEVQTFGLGLPHLIGPAHELLEKNHSYVTRNVWNSSWIIWRSEKAGYQAFLNRCRHRGMKLVDDQPKMKTSGLVSDCDSKAHCGTHIVCPYHRWTYGEDGACTFIPKQSQAFPKLDLHQIRLQRREVVERQGLLWLLGSNIEQDSSNSILGEISKNIPDLKTARLISKQVYEVASNWKVIHESFLESYHVPFVHEKTLSPATISHLGLIDYYGPHSRAVYPLKRLQSEVLKGEGRSIPQGSHLRKLVSVVYQLFPNAFLSFQPFHILVTRLCPTAIDRTRVEVFCLVEKANEEGFPALVERDIEFVRKGMLEDFEVAEKVQQTLGYQTSEQVDPIEETFLAGAYEAQITHFHKSLQNYLKNGSELLQLRK